MRAPPGLCAALATWTIGCSLGASPPLANRATLPAGNVASVGGELIASASVERIAAQQRLAPQAALELALTDALLAKGARTSITPGTTSSIERAVAARQLLEQMAANAGSRGPVTDDELAALVSERWVELDRPDAVRTTHFVVQVKDPATEAKAQALAQELALAVAPTTDAAGFIKAAKSLPSGDLDVRAEALPAMTSDGRGIVPREGHFVQQGVFDPDFARAAGELTRPGQLSPVVRSRFGFHVIRLEERIPGAHMPLADRSRLLTPEALTRRAVRERGELLAKLRQGVRIEIDRAADDLTARLEVAP